MIPLLLSVPLIAAAPVPKDFKKETQVLNGAWLCVGEDYCGQKMNQNVGATWRFDGDSLTIEKPQANPYKLRISSDPTTTPAEFRFADNQNEFSVYEIKGDTLTICVSVTRGVKPEGIGPGPKILVYTLTRAKDK